LLFHLFRKSVATHTPQQLVIKSFVANKDRACGLHPGNGRSDVWRGGKQEVLHYVDFVVEAKKPEAGLEHTYIRFTAREDYLFFVQMLEVLSDLSILRQVEEILFDKFGHIAQVRHDFPGAGSLLIHWPFERHHDRNSEIREQSGKAPGVCDDPGANSFPRLRQKKILHIDDYPTTAARDDLTGTRMSGSVGQCRISVVRAARTIVAISEYAATVGASTL